MDIRMVPSPHWTVTESGLHAALSRRAVGAAGGDTADEDDSVSSQGGFHGDPFARKPAADNQQITGVVMSRFHGRIPSASIDGFKWEDGIIWRIWVNSGLDRFSDIMDVENSQRKRVCQLQREEIGSATKSEGSFIVEMRGGAKCKGRWCLLSYISPVLSDTGPRPSLHDD
jgi:hypothetical protein